MSVVEYEKCTPGECELLLRALKSEEFRLRSRYLPEFVRQPSNEDSAGDEEKIYNRLIFYGDVYSNIDFFKMANFIGIFQYIPKPMAQEIYQKIHENIKSDKLSDDFREIYSGK